MSLIKVETGSTISIDPEPTKQRWIDAINATAPEENWTVKRHWRSFLEHLAANTPSLLCTSGLEVLQKLKSQQLNMPILTVKTMGTVKTVDTIENIWNALLSKEISRIPDNAWNHLLTTFVDNQSLCLILATYNRPEDFFNLDEVEAQIEPHFHIVDQNTTAESEIPFDCLDRLQRLFETALEERFEDGIETEFSKGLTAVIKAYGNIAIQEIVSLILYRRTNSEVAGEALRWIGQIEDPTTHRFRLWLLEQSLNSSSARIRDAASLGLASLDDPQSIPALQQAIEKEPYTELREDMEQVLEGLQRTR